MIETDKKFYRVPVIIISTVWEEGYHIYEAETPEEALDMYHSERKMPIDIEYTGWLDQEYKYDEINDLGDEVELIPNERSDIQCILKRDEEKKNDNI